jgi:hypothetical protein
MPMPANNKVDEEDCVPADHAVVEINVMFSQFDPPSNMLALTVMPVALS